MQDNQLIEETKEEQKPDEPGCFAMVIGCCQEGKCSVYNGACGCNKGACECPPDSLCRKKDGRVTPKIVFKAGSNIITVFFGEYGEYWLGLFAVLLLAFIYYWFF